MFASCEGAVTARFAATATSSAQSKDMAKVGLLIGVIGLAIVYGAVLILG